MTSDLAAYAYAHRDAIWAVVAFLLGSANPPRWLVRIRQFPFARAASVLRVLAMGLEWIAGEVDLHPTVAPSALPTGAAPTTTTSTETSA